MRLLALLLLASTFAFAQQQSYEQLLKHWDYDRNIPLNVKDAGAKDHEGIEVHDISYASPVGDRGASVGPNAGTVTAYLVVPPGKGPFPAILYGHWCMPGSKEMNRDEFLDEALVMARTGVLSLLPDHVITRPGFVQDKTDLNTQQIDVLVQQVVNMRRGIDLLTSRRDVDPRRIAYVGHSCDAEVGGFLSGIERKRLKAVVIMAGPLSDQAMIKTKVFQDYRQKIGPEKFDSYTAKYRWTDAGLYASHSGGLPKLLQFATHEDLLTPELARQFLPYVSDPKELKGYDAEHALNPEATRDRIAFLVTQLGAKAPDAAAVAAIPALVQPPTPK